ncbi:DUF1989 domain-containing protein [Paenibacillus sp. GCM10012307]|uniref:Urea carboxylase-associated family protein n=1 Tax=Paenibacillus roseus TaxID=2798579 RepID=A0A934J1S9_9BACL|nr:urea carboxylase-associated family protein [Paenibacillus roseus]MBJ6360004.1 urea carboxylase-associated family protein [Paenibacillus roseus]
MSSQHWLIPATEELGFKLLKGHIVRITDVEGEQVADFVAFNANDPSERLDPGVTLDTVRSKNVTPGDIIYSTRYRPVFTILSDTVGRHDLLLPACRPEMYEVLYDKKDHISCYDNLNHALAAFGIPAADQHTPFNLFMNTVVDADGSVRVERPLSRAGDYIELRAEMDLIVAVSACPCAESACNGYTCTSIAIDIR